MRIHILRGWRSRLTFAVLLCLCLHACVGGKKKTLAPSPPQRAFYYWRTTFHLSEAEIHALADLNIERLYVRLLDVDRESGDAAPRPVGQLTGLDATSLSRLEVVPVIYLRNRALRGLDAHATGRLADQIWQESQRTMARLGTKWREIQLDCDWNETTRETFFALLTNLAPHTKLRKLSLSTTIRLHQVKYRERTGVPPVDRGMLMFYNMGPIDADSDTQAIFDAAHARPYLGRLHEYPLPLDVALPIWSWVVQVRDDRVMGLLQNTDRDALVGKTWLQARGENRFEVMESAFLNGALLRQGDLLHIEGGRAETSQAAADLAAAHMGTEGQLTGHGPRGTVALFDLSEKNLAHHDTPSLARLFAAFR